METNTQIGATMNILETPNIPEGRLSGQRFFHVGDKDFHYVSDQPVKGYSRSRPEVWLTAVNHAAEIGATMIEERTNQRLNDYVGSGVYGLAFDGNGNPTTSLLSNLQYGASKVVATYAV